MIWRRVYFTFPGGETWFFNEIAPQDQSRGWLFVAALYDAASEIVISTDAVPFTMPGEVKPPYPNLNDGVFVEWIKREAVASRAGAKERKTE